MKYHKQILKKQNSPQWTEKNEKNGAKPGRIVLLLKHLTIYAQCFWNKENPKEIFIFQVRKTKTNPILKLHICIFISLEPLVEQKC